jgi:hypothetical protein
MPEFIYALILSLGIDCMSPGLNCTVFKVNGENKFIATVCAFNYSDPQEHTAYISLKEKRILTVHINRCRVT